MLKCISDIIEGMGFKSIDGVYTSTFLFKPTGNILKITVDDLFDDPSDDAIVRFGVYNMEGDLQDIHTLDQMLVIRHTQLIPAEVEWKDEYAVYFDVRIEVPVKLNELCESARKALLVDYLTDKDKLIKNLAHDMLVDEITDSKLSIVTSQFNRLEKVITE